MNGISKVGSQYTPIVKETPKVENKNEEKVQSSETKNRPKEGEIIDITG